jgi:hypothetical protein
VEEGVRNFNGRKFWEAHEAWETLWRKLEGNPRLYLQALIQTTAAFHLRKLGRLEAASKQARAAREKLRRSGGADCALGTVPVVVIDDLEEALEVLGEACDESQESAKEWLKWEKKLKARIKA